MLHPVGPLPAAVYWRRRLMVLSLLVAVLGGGGWFGFALLTGGSEGSGRSAAGASASPTEPDPEPALERVTPSLASVQTPTAPASPTAVPPEPTGPRPGDPCRDDMIAVQVRAPAGVAVASGPTLELVVVNISPVPCVRVLDLELQEIVLLDAQGARLWGSNDCQPEASDDIRTLAPGEQVAFPLVWTGLSSEQTCTVPRTAIQPGQYVLRGRLDTAVSGDTPLAVG